MEDFEKMLSEMSKPEIIHLKHKDLLSKAIVTAKDKFVLSWWWLCIPVYVLAMLFMKSIFMRNTTFFSNVHEYIKNNKYSAVLFFVAMPLVFAIINFVSVRNIYKLHRSTNVYFLKAVWLNILLIIVSLLLIFIFL